jgi:hypothetical protein
VTVESALSAAPDYEVEYNNRARVPENPTHMAGWARDAAAYREARHGRWRAIPYGPARATSSISSPLAPMKARSSSLSMAATGRRSIRHRSAISRPA